MKNALGGAQHVVLLGGASEIGRAIVGATASPATRRVVLAGRRPESMTADGLGLPGSVEVATVEFDAVETATHADVVERIAAAGDIDLAIVAFGALGDQAAMEADPASAVGVAEVNYVGAVSVCLHLAARMRRQGHGTIVVLSSVAGQRARAENFVYGSTKAGLDAFAQGLQDSLVGTGVDVLIVRPGFVHSRMTAGMDAAPFATTPDAVGAAVAAALRSRRLVVWVPGVLRAVFLVLRHLPRAVFRRLSS